MSLNLKRHHSGRDATPHHTGDYVEPRRQTKTSADVILGLCQVVHDQLYRDDQRKNFWSQNKELKAALTWPAEWFNERGIFVSGERYQEIMMEVIQEAKRHGATGVVGHWPLYLLKCVQSHFDANAHLYNDEGKRARDLVNRITAKLTGAPAATEAPDHFIRVTAEAHALVKSPGKRPKVKKPAAPADPQTTFTL
jgi:hypothetical protein